MAYEANEELSSINAMKPRCANRLSRIRDCVCNSLCKTCEGNLDGGNEYLKVPQSDLTHAGIETPKDINFFMALMSWATHVEEGQ